MKSRSKFSIISLSPIKVFKRSVKISGKADLIAPKISKNSDSLTDFSESIQKREIFSQIYLRIL